MQLCFFVPVVYCAVLCPLPPFSFCIRFQARVSRADPLTIPAFASTCLYRCLWDIDQHADLQSDPLTTSVLLPTSVYIVISVVYVVTMYKS